MFKALIFLILAIPLASKAQWFINKPVCDSIFRSTNYGCDDLARSNNLGGSFPQLFDAFNINPSAIPTKLTPVGLEVFSSGGDFNYSLLKGHNVAGTAFSSSDTESLFFSNMNNYEVASRNYSYQGQN
ncbi:MAG: hypothetical protein WCG27_07840, partial [Pseudomonadota bacterium]